MELSGNAAPAAGNARNASRERLHQRLLEVLGEWYGPPAVVRGGVPLRLGGQLLRPDVAVYRNAAGPQPAATAAADLPLLAVVILNPAAPFGPQVATARQLVAAGVPACWLVEPRLRTVTITAAPDRYQSFNQHETLRDPATGIELELARLFG